MSFQIGGKVLCHDPIKGLDPDTVYTITEVAARRGEIYLQVQPGDLDTWYVASRFTSWVAPTERTPLRKVRPELFVMTVGDSQRHLPMWVLNGFLRKAPSLYTTPEKAQ